ncbi:hypothetical protein WDU94_002225 [Cyamophila willieti]
MGIERANDDDDDDMMMIMIMMIVELSIPHLDRYFHLVGGIRTSHLHISRSDILRQVSTCWSFGDAVSTELHKMFSRGIVLFCVAIFHFIHASSAITSSDDRFVKKYAMMKVYESCYGPEVLKEVRKEMKAAASKCSTYIPAQSAGSTYAASSNAFKVSPPYSSSASSHGPSSHISASSHSASSHYTKPSTMTSSSLHEESKTTPISNNGIDVAKLQQMILAGYKNVNSQQQSAQSQQQQQSQQHSQLQQQTPYSAAIQPQAANPASSSLSPTNANILQQVAAAAALSQLPAASQNQLRPYFSTYNNPLQSALGSMFYPNNMFGAQSLNPFFPGQINPYTAALYGSFGLNPFFPGRSSRDMDLRQLEGMSRMGGKVKNVTCVMQELGYNRLT